MALVQVQGLRFHTRTSIKSHSFRSIRNNEVNFLTKRRFFLCRATKNENQDSTSSETPNVTETTEKNEGVESNAEKDSSPDDIGKQLAQLRLERQDSDDNSKDFWTGVLEETQLIQWPTFSNVLGTTSVVLGIIFGSSVVLLTLNAVLAQVSDAVFANPTVAEFWHLSQ